MEAIQEQALQAAGLTKNESKVYLALLKLNTATASEITKSSRVHRVNVYDALERLREKGLISSIMRSNKRIYEAASPEQLLKLLKEKEEIVQGALPSLRQEFTLKRDQQLVHFFIGPEGVMQAYYMMLKQQKTIYAIGGSGFNRKYLKHRHVMFNKDRIAQGVHGKVLYYEFTRKDKNSGWSSDELMEIKYIPDEFQTPGMVDICGDVVVNLLPTADTLMAIVIENRLIADTYREFFRFMWQFAKS